MTTAGTLPRRAGALVRAISIALFGAAAFVATGCTVTARTPSADAYVYSEPVPEDAYARYPTTEYDGRTYVWYRDRWIYRHHGGWAYLREEPYELRRRRPYVQEAPPAYAPRAYGGGPPPPLPAPR